jgi:hypothetical protein
MRRTKRTVTTTNHETTSHSTAFAAAANAIPEAEAGTERNGPPRTSHHTATPGSTKLDSGFLNTDGMTVIEPSAVSAVALVIASTTANRHHHRRGPGTEVWSYFAVKK